MMPDILKAHRRVWLIPFAISLLALPISEASLIAQTGWHPAQIVSVRCPDTDPVYSPLCKQYCERGGTESTLADLDVNCIPRLKYDFQFSILRWRSCMEIIRTIKAGPEGDYGFNFQNFTNCVTGLESTSTIEFFGHVGYFQESYVAGSKWRPNPEQNQFNFDNPSLDDLNLVQTSRRRRLQASPDGGWSMRVRRQHSLPVYHDLDWHHPSVTPKDRRQLLGLGDDPSDEDQWMTVTDKDELTPFGVKAKHHKVQKTTLGDLHLSDYVNTPLSIYGKRGILRMLQETDDWSDTAGKAGCDIMYQFPLHEGLIECPNDLTSNCTWSVEAGRGDFRPQGKLKPIHAFSSSHAPSIHGTPVALTKIANGRFISLRNETQTLTKSVEILPNILGMSAWFSGFCDFGAWFNRDMRRRLLEEVLGEQHVRRLSELDHETTTDELLNELISDEVFDKLSNHHYHQTVAVGAYEQAMNSDFFYDSKRPVKRMRSDSDSDFEKAVHLRYGPRMLLSHTRRKVPLQELNQHSRDSLLKQLSPEEMSQFEQEMRVAGVSLFSVGPSPNGTIRGGSELDSLAQSHRDPNARMVLERPDLLPPGFDDVIELSTVPMEPNDDYQLPATQSADSASATAAAKQRRLDLMEHYTDFADWEYKGELCWRHWMMAPRWDRARVFGNDDQFNQWMNDKSVDLTKQPMLDTYSNLYGVPTVNRAYAFPKTFFERVNDLWPRPSAFLQERVEVNGGNFCGSLTDCALCQAAINCDWCLTPNYEFRCVDYCLEKWIQPNCEAKFINQVARIKRRNGVARHSPGLFRSACLFAALAASLHVII